MEWSEAKSILKIRVYSVGVGLEYDSEQIMRNVYVHEAIQAGWGVAMGY